MAKVEPTMLLLLGSVLSVGPASPLGMSPSSGGEAEAGKVLHPQEWCFSSEQWNTAEMSEILLNLSQTSLLKQRFVNTWASPYFPSSSWPSSISSSSFCPSSFSSSPTFLYCFSPSVFYSSHHSLGRVLLVCPSLPQQGRHCGKRLCLIFIPEKNLIHFPIFSIFLLSFFAWFCPPLSSPFLLSFLLPSASAFFLLLFFLCILFLHLSLLSFSLSLAPPPSQGHFCSVSKAAFSSHSISWFSHLRICYCSGNLGVVPTGAISLPHSAEHTDDVPLMLPESEQAWACPGQHMCPLTTDPCDPLTQVDRYCNYS